MYRCTFEQQLFCAIATAESVSSLFLTSIYTYVYIRVSRDKLIPQFYLPYFHVSNKSINEPKINEWVNSLAFTRGLNDVSC